MPSGVVTVTCTAPSVSAGGTVAVIVFELFTVKATLCVPKRTSVAPVRSVPPILIALPPAPGPWFGLSLRITGGLVWYVYSSPGVTALVPPSGELTVTSTIPAEPGGETTLSFVCELTAFGKTTSVAPKCTVVTPLRASPVIVTFVPPLVGP